VALRSQANIASATFSRSGDTSATAQEKYLYSASGVQHTWLLGSRAFWAVAAPNPRQSQIFDL